MNWLSWLGCFQEKSNLARIKNKQVGLALGGGASLGSAHVGVLRALKEYEIEIQYVAGTSIGAFVAALFAFGKDVDEIEAIARDLTWLKVSSFSIKKLGLLSNSNIGKTIIEHLGDVDIEDAQIPLAINTTDMDTGQRVVLTSGNLAKAVQASTCLPVIYIPVEIDERNLVDGALTDNVPIQSARSLGAEFVIASDLAAKRQYKQPKDLVDVLVNTIGIAIDNTTRLQTKTCDLLITPDTSEFSRRDTRNFDALIEQGYDAACEVLQA